MLSTFQSRFGDRTLHEHAHQSPSSIGDRTLPADGLAAGPVLLARVNHGRWIVDCLTPGCGGAEYAAPYIDGVPVFFCCECRNWPTGGHPLPVTFPLERDEIEGVLHSRPDRKTRNWQLGDTLDDMRAENREHGIS